MGEFVKGVLVLFMVYVFGVVSGCIAAQRYYEEHLDLNLEKVELEIQLLKQQLKKYK